MTKDHPIATPVTLSIIPRTVSAQIESGSSLPPNIPADDIRSPPFAGKSTAWLIIFMRMKLLYIPHHVRYE